MLCKTHKVISWQACSTWYNVTMILPLFDYCLLSGWRGHMNYLDELQKHAVSIIVGHKVQQGEVSATLSRQ